MIHYIMFNKIKASSSRVEAKAAITEFVNSLKSKPKPYIIIVVGYGKKELMVAILAANKITHTLTPVNRGSTIFEFQ